MKKVPYKPNNENKHSFDFLNQCVSYDPETGYFVSKIDGRKYKYGDKVGFLNKEGYVLIWIAKKIYMAHRLAYFLMFKRWPDIIDHINGIKTDNRIINLRNVPKIENHRNLGLNKKNTSGVTGVCFYKRTSQWTARIMFNYKQIHLGYFDDIDSAKEARDLAAKQYKFHKNHGTERNGIS